MKVRVKGLAKATQLPTPCCSVCNVGSDEVREGKEEEDVESAEKACEHGSRGESPHEIRAQDRKREKGHSQVVEDEGFRNRCQTF